MLRMTGDSVIVLSPYVVNTTEKDGRLRSPTVLWSVEQSVTDESSLMKSLSMILS
jgi:hypothetical protein